MPDPAPPSDISAEDRGVFDRVAERISESIARAWFFTGAVLLVLVWVPTVFLFNSVDTWQLVISTLTSVASFLLIALLQNSERRSDQALHRKIDMLAAAMATQMREQQNEDIAAIRRAIAELEAAVRLEERM